MKFNEAVRDTLESMYIHLDRDSKKGKEILTLSIYPRKHLSNRIRVFTLEILCVQ